MSRLDIIFAIAAVAMLCATCYAVPAVGLALLAVAYLLAMLVAAIWPALLVAIICWIVA
jgi:hypothetical protein